MKSIRNTAAMALLAACAALVATPARAQDLTVREIARLSTDSEFTLQGLGLVIGLPGTGDSGKELATALPLAQVLARNGTPIPDLKALEKTRSIALVMVTCAIPSGGARANDALDVIVSTMGSASSLKGGQLYITPLRGPTPGAPVYAMASGTITIQDPEAPTTCRVPAGGKLIADLAMPAPGDRFELVLHPHFRGYSSTSHVAMAINDSYFNSPTADGNRLARAIDDRSILVDIPTGERADPAAFLADIMSTPVSAALLKLPAQVICNVRTGTILLTGDVRVSPVAITKDGLTITTTTPPPTPTVQDPLVERSRWVGLATVGSETATARLQELLEAFKRLDVSARDQIEILQELHKTGRLHAQLIVE